MAEEGRNTGTETATSSSAHVVVVENGQDDQLLDGGSQQEVKENTYPYFTELDPGIKNNIASFLGIELYSGLALVNKTGYTISKELLRDEGYLKQLNSVYFHMSCKNGLWYHLLNLIYPSEFDADDKDLTVQHEELKSQMGVYFQQFGFDSGLQIVDNVIGNITSKWSSKLPNLIGTEEAKTLSKHFPKIKNYSLKLKDARDLQQFYKENYADSKETKEKDKKAANQSGINIKNGDKQKRNRELLKFLQETHKDEQLLADALFIKSLYNIINRSINGTVSSNDLNHIIALLENEHYQRTCSWRIWAVVLSLPNKYIRYFTKYHERFSNLMSRELNNSSMILELLDISPLVDRILLKQVYKDGTFVFDFLINLGFGKELLKSFYGETIKGILERRHFEQEYKRIFNQLDSIAGDESVDEKSDEVKAELIKREIIADRNKYVGITDLSEMFLPRGEYQEEVKDSKDREEINPLLVYILKWSGRYGIIKFAKALIGDDLSFEQIKGLLAKVRAGLPEIVFRAEAVCASFFSNLTNEQWSDLCDDIIQRATEVQEYYRAIFKHKDISKIDGSRRLYMAKLTALAVQTNNFLSMLADLLLIKKLHHMYFGFAVGVPVIREKIPEMLGNPILIKYLDFNAIMACVKLLALEGFLENNIKLKHDYLCKLTANELITLALPKIGTDDFRKFLFDDLCSPNSVFLDRFESKDIAELYHKTRVKGTPYRLLRNARVVDTLSDEDLFQFLYWHDPDFEEENILRLLSESKADDGDPAKLNERMPPDMWVRFFTTASPPVNGIFSNLIISKISTKQILMLILKAMNDTLKIFLSDIFIYLIENSDISTKKTNLSSFIEKINSLNDQKIIELNARSIELNNKNRFRYPDNISEEFKKENRDLENIEIKTALDLLLFLLLSVNGRTLYGESGKSVETMKYMESAKEAYDKLIEKTFNSKWPRYYKHGQENKKELEQKEQLYAKSPTEKSDSESSDGLSTDLFDTNPKPKYSNKWYYLSIGIGFVLGVAAVLSGIGIIPVPLIATCLFASFGGTMFLGGLSGAAVIYCKNKKYNKFPQNPVPAKRTETSFDSRRSSHEKHQTRSRHSRSCSSNPGQNPAALLCSRACTGNHAENKNSNGQQFHR